MKLINSYHASRVRVNIESASAWRHQLFLLRSASASNAWLTPLTRSRLVLVYDSRPIPNVCLYDCVGEHIWSTYNHSNPVKLKSRKKIETMIYTSKLPPYIGTVLMASENVHIMCTLGVSSNVLKIIWTGNPDYILTVPTHYASFSGKLSTLLRQWRWSLKYLTGCTLKRQVERT